MATHGTAHGAKLDRLLAYHEEAARAIRLTMELLSGSAKAAKATGHATVLADAIALDGARVAKTKTTKGKKQKRDMSRSVIRAQRERTAQVLGMFDPKTPRPVEDVARELGVSTSRTGIAPLLHHKYLRRKGAGYIRTAKAYVVDKFGSTNGTAAAG